jgi:hypothetical protein
MPQRKRPFEKFGGGWQENVKVNLKYGVSM